MTTKDKEIKQALEALRLKYSDIIYDGASPDKAIAFEMDIAELISALAQPEQEPVDFRESVFAAYLHLKAVEDEYVGIAANTAWVRFRERFDWIVQQLKPKAQPAPAVQPEASLSEMATLKRERDGWKEEAECLQKRLRFAQADNDLLRSHAKKDVWYWQGDGYDHLESMGNNMVVVIHANDLRAMLAAAPQAPAVQSTYNTRQLAQQIMSDCGCRDSAALLERITQRLAAHGIGAPQPKE